MSVTTGNGWFDTLVLSLDSEQRSPLGQKMPGYPPEELQRNTTGLSSKAALQQAYAFYEDVQDSLRKAGKQLGVSSKVLDFGFGWGRISRVFMKEIPIEGIYGIDVDPDFVALTQSLFGSDQFALCDPFPPAAHPAGEFDLVYAYSVFSHLSEGAARAWLLDFHRMLKPGGFVAFTSRHESFFDYIDWARTAPGVDPYTRALGHLFENTAAPRSLLKQGRLVHATSKGVSGGGVRDESFYGETWIPERYLLREFGDQFEHLATCFDARRYDQVLFVLRKRG
jgi:2-polyprenyl-3-methyl-5-hydroxy-6-metoxy-1,4-benzoquinol methylase